MARSKLTTKTLIHVMILTLFVSCKTDKKEQVKEIEVKKDNVIEIVTNLMDFVTQDTVPSGWNTFKYINKSSESHFVLFDDYPEGKGKADAEREVMPPFDKGMELIMQGKMDEAMAAFGELPEWFSKIVFVGGSGIVSPNHSNEFTLNLKPGNHMLECYVKMVDGKFHSSMGMTKDIWVTEADSGLQPPKADIDITISSTEGIQYNGDITKGEHTFKVYYKDQIVYGNFVGHDVNLVKLGDNSNLDALQSWMNWATPTGLMTPMPTGITFLGGTNDAPAGSTQYFKVNLEPGNYAFISEVPNSKSKGLLKTFEVRE